MNTAEATTAIADALAAIAPEVDLTVVDVDAPLRTELDLDSLDFLGLVQSLHDSTGVDIPEVDYVRVETLAELTAYVAGHTKT
jgi:acyl carrier protein